MSTLNLTLHNQVDQESCWHIFPNIEGTLRRHPTIDRIKRNLPLLESGIDVVTRASQSKELSAFMQAFNNNESKNSSAGFLGNPEIIRAVGKARFVVGTIGMISAVAKVALEISNIIVEAWKNRPRERNDAIVRLSEGVISLGDAVSSFGKSLSMAGWADQAKILHWALPLGYVSALLSSVTVYINWRAANDSRKLIDRIDDAVDFNWLAEEISNPQKDGDYFVQKHFEVSNREKYGAQISYIAREGSEDEDAKSNLKVALKDRLSDKISSHNQAIVSTIISIFATVCLFFPVLGMPMVWTGLGLAIIAGIISINKYLKDRKSIKLFEKRINTIQPFDNIQSHWIRKNAKFAIPCLNEVDQEKPSIELLPMTSANVSI